MVALSLFSQANAIGQEAKSFNAPPVRLCSLCYKISTLYNSYKDNIELGGNYKCWDVRELDAQKNFCGRILDKCNQCSQSNPCKGISTKATLQDYKLELIRHNLWSILNKPYIQECDKILAHLKDIRCFQNRGQCKKYMKQAINNVCNPNIINCDRVQDVSNLDCNPNNVQCYERIYHAIHAYCKPKNNKDLEINWPDASIKHIHNCPSYSFPKS